MFFFKSFAHFCPNLIFKKNCYFFLWFYKSSSWFFSQKQAGAELKQKKKFFLGPKLGKKFENKVQKLSNLKKKGLFGPKKTSWGWAWANSWGTKLIIKAKNWPIQKKKEKKDFSGQKNKLGLSLRREKRIFWVQNWEKISE